MSTGVLDLVAAALTIAIVRVLIDVVPLLIAIGG